MKSKLMVPNIVAKIVIYLFQNWQSVFKQNKSITSLKADLFVLLVHNKTSIRKKHIKKIII